MKTYKFKTNINCGGCIKSVTPYLNQLRDSEWDVDINDKRKILTVKSASVTEIDIINKVIEAGYTVEPLKGGIWHKIFK